ncbi:MULTISPECIES: CadD family cadmium resistance transporter [Enterococcus]|uniref:CadD family cadmium resistance transporter n=1 Tax=Salmonella typhimurium TaxID=90371 RepID=A0A713XVZ0_SALTM|nr:MULTISPECIES: CadD family cadmium resistance transporter [Enterococcus]ERK34064.1 cadmium resistance protein CadD [Enterococcus faecium CRL1879]HAD3920834.1 CadD family cadmium resistance transporter [Salmonella enterica subsp. enterica serovar Typhimurium]AOM35913.1 cadmium resistance protein CadD [Enterococcus faecium]EGO5802450.1 CadD family cadmium resistance transporter [Enterococcus faecalis]EGP4727002.1 CadD family cadmium resistance transporter [Enterococcus faecium]
MLQSIFSAIAVYISTSIDYLFILLIIFSQSHTQKGIRHIFWGQYLGTGILVAVSLFAAYVLNFIPQDWIIGLLGLIPIYLGIRVAVIGEEEEEEEEVVEKLESRGTSWLFWTVALITIASGGDNLGIYIPYFTSLAFSEIVITLIVFAFSVAILCYVSYKLAKISFVSETLEKYERIIVPIVFIGLGIYILIENGTIQTLLSLFN